MATIAVSKSAGNFVVTVTIPEVEIAVEGRDNIRREIMATVQQAAGRAHLGIQRTDASLDADENMGRRQVAEIKVGRAAFSGV